MEKSADAKVDEGASKVDPDDFYANLRYNIVPPAFLVFFTFITQILVIIGNPDLTFGFGFIFSFITGLFSFFAWKVVLGFYLWAYLSLRIPNAPTFKGPATPKGGYVPVYSANGTQFYLISLVAYFILVFLNPDIPVWVYEDFGSIAAVLNLTALLLCAYLMMKGQNAPEEKKDIEDWEGYPVLYLFYRGIELHPRLADVDIKQWTNCRVGMMGWAILVINFCLANIRIHGFETTAAGSVVNAILINIYLLKFFYWETGYFNTLDITLDRAGYYLCWGCLCWVQVFYTFSAYYMVGNPSKANVLEAAAILMFGCVSILLNYMADVQKEKFRASNGQCYIWGRPAKFLAVEYKNHEGKIRKSRLMLSGFWGVARHMNYVFEIMLAFSWSLPAIHYGMTPFYYVFFLIILLVHRTFRDEEKCSNKYGKGWENYCEKVPYRLIPGIF